MLSSEVRRKTHPRTLDFSHGWFEMAMLRLLLPFFLYKSLLRASKRAQRVKELASKPEDLQLALRSHMVKEEN